MNFIQMHQQRIKQCVDKIRNDLSIDQYESFLNKEPRIIEPMLTNKRKKPHFVGKAPEHLQKPIEWRKGSKHPCKNMNVV